MKKILVVENSPTIISVADSLLRQRGYDVTCLSSGEKALAYARTEKPDLILTALGISDMDGIQICQSIISEPLTGGIPVVLLVGDKDSVFEDQLDSCGARGLIKKPFSPKELIRIVEKFAGESQPKVVRRVDQTSGTGPRLQPVSPQEIGTATQNVIKETGSDQKHETVFNLDWHDLKDDPDFTPGPRPESETDDSGLVLDEDQYGLTKLTDEVVPFQKASSDEDYDWFVGEMKKEIEGPPPSQPENAAKPQSQPAKSQVTYKDLESPVSKDDSKYRKFLDQFKKEAEELSEQPASPEAKTDINWLADRIAEKLAQKIVAKLDRQELKQIIGSLLDESK